MEIRIRVCMKLESLQGMESIIGRLAVFLKASLNQDCVVVKGCGREDLEEVISMKGIGSVIKNRDLECLLGRRVMSIRGIMLMIYEKDMERCFRLMELCLRVIGREIS